MRYAESRDAALLDPIVSAYTPLVRGVVADFIFSSVSTEDLLQVGYIGLLKALDGFDPSRGVRFEAYARPLIRGEIQHYLRDYADAIRRPRWSRTLNNQIEETVARHLSNEGRFPGLEQLAADLNLSRESLLESLAALKILRTVSLTEDEDAEEPRTERIPHATDVDLAVEDRMALFDALEKLNPLPRRVLYYLFFTDLTQAETAKRVGISQKHVSRVLASSLSRLRTLLTSG